MLTPLFTHIPGLKVVCPSNAYDCKGLLIQAIRDNDPVIFLEHKNLYASMADVPEEPYTIPFGEANIVREGRDATIVTYGQMVGRSVDQIFPKHVAAPGETVLKVEDLSHPTEFDGIDFELRRGEILGFYGLVGAGRSEVMQALFGLTRPSRGSIVLDGQAITPQSPADAVNAGIVYVPEERGKQGVVIGLPIFENVSLPSLKRTSLHGVLRLKEEFDLARAYTERLDLRASSLSQDVGTLSGGNQQKVVIAKWLATGPKVIILDEPTKGIDIGSKAAVHGFMAELVSQGLSVIMVSSELPEILGMSDRVVVMREGRIAATYDNKGLDAETLVRTAAGIAA